MDRQLRLAAIRRLVREGHVTQQDDLIGALARDGFRVTQSTLSRDLRHLRVGRIPDGDRGHRYELSDGEPMIGARGGLIDDVKNGLLSLAVSGNVLVVRTLPGHGSSVARALDNLEVEYLLGTIAGDDTVIGVIREGIGRGACLRQLDAVVPGVAELAT